MNSDLPLISFVIIGAAKAGTSSLASWLQGHPDVCMSSPKESMFFGSPHLFDKGLQFFHSSFFAHYAGERFIGEATPAYSDRDRHPGTPLRLYNTNKNAKIVYIVRHPLRKVESSWQMLTNLSPELATTPENRLYLVRAREGFAAFIQDPVLFRHFVSVCSYQYQINAWRAVFPERQVHIMFLEDLEANRDVEIYRLCIFLGINPDPLLGENLRPENTLSSRRTSRKYVSSIVSTGLHRLFPASLRRRILSTPFFSFSQSAALRPVWPMNILARFRDEIQHDLGDFLAENGKSCDFYPFTP